MFGNSRLAEQVSDGHYHDVWIGNGGPGDFEIEGRVRTIGGVERLYNKGLRSNPGYIGADRRSLVDAQRHGEGTFRAQFGYRQPNSNAWSCDDEVSIHFV